MLDFAYLKYQFQCLWVRANLRQPPDMFFGTKLVHRVLTKVVERIFEILIFSGFLVTFSIFAGRKLGKIVQNFLQGSRFAHHRKKYFGHPKNPIFFLQKIDPRPKTYLREALFTFRLAVWSFANPVLLLLLLRGK